MAHGHDYRIEVTVEGEIHERTGMAIDLSEFAGERAIPTTENLARVICSSREA